MVSWKVRGMVMPSVGVGALAGPVAAVGGEAGPLLLDDAGEEGLGVADGVAAGAALLGIDREHELAAPGRAAVAGVHFARLEAEETPTSAPARSSIMRATDAPL